MLPHNTPMRLVLMMLALVVFSACSSAPADATEPAAATPVVVELPKATHAGDLVFEPDGSLWFDGRYGREHAGDGAGFIGHIQSGGQMRVERGVRVALDFFREPEAPVWSHRDLLGPAMADSSVTTSARPATRRRSPKGARSSTSAPDAIPPIIGVVASAA
jgi:hypothetical protein